MQCLMVEPLHAAWFDAEPTSSFVEAVRHVLQGSHHNSGLYVRHGVGYSIAIENSDPYYLPREGVRFIMDVPDLVAGLGLVASMLNAVPVTLQLGPTRLPEPLVEDLKLVANAIPSITVIEVTCSSGHAPVLDFLATPSSSGGWPLPELEGLTLHGGSDQAFLLSEFVKKRWGKCRAKSFGSPDDQDGEMIRPARNLRVFVCGEAEPGDVQHATGECGCGF